MDREEDPENELVGANPHFQKYKDDTQKAIQFPTILSVVLGVLVFILLADSFRLHKQLSQQNDLIEMLLQQTGNTKTAKSWEMQGSPLNETVKALESELDDVSSTQARLITEVAGLTADVSLMPSQKVVADT